MLLTINLWQIKMQTITDLNMNTKQMMKKQILNCNNKRN
jgi:hypothetical protein